MAASSPSSLAIESVRSVKSFLPSSVSASDSEKTSLFRRTIAKARACGRPPSLMLRNQPADQISYFERGYQSATSKTLNGRFANQTLMCQNDNPTICQNNNVQSAKICSISISDIPAESDGMQIPKRAVSTRPAQSPKCPPRTSPCTRAKPPARP